MGGGGSERPEEGTKEPQGTDLQAHSYPSGTRDGGRLVHKRLAQSSAH